MSSEHKPDHKYSSVTGKDTIYIDVDDEITTIIDKLRASPQKIVALVLPKRATVLQSIVNMKLLKRTSDDAEKQAVLITSEASLLPLAGSVGLYVAKTLQSKPEVPLVPNAGAADAADDEPLLMDDDQSSDVPLDSTKPVGELATGKHSPTAVDETIDLDNGDVPAPAAGKKGKKGAGKLKVPDFSRFRLKLILGVAGIILLIGAWILCFNVLPKAAITVKTNASEIESNLTVTLNTAATALDEKGGVVPAQGQQIQKPYSQQVPATGQKDEGTKASGKVTLALGDCSLPQVTIPAGTGLSASGLTFIMQQEATLTSVKVGSQCRNSDFPSFSTATVDVTAQNNGDKYNLPKTNYTVAGFSTVSGSGTAMTGGTSALVKVVSQVDIDGAKQKIATQDAAPIKLELQTALQKAGLLPLATTFKASDPAITTTANVGDKADAVTVSATIAYTMFGAKQTDLQTLIANDVKKKINPAKQTILENDAAKATFAVQSQEDKKVVLAVHATSVAGPDLKVGDLRKQVAGKKASNAQTIIKANPGVTDVTVKYSPFWVSSIPDNPGKVSIIIEKPAHNER